jgi:hypothetical protein
MDSALRRFVDATDEAEAERELNSLLEHHALPLANAIVSRKLRTYRRDTGRSEVQDREDVIADAMMMLVQRLQAARSEANRPPIEHFDSYAAAVILSACAHHIRRRYPERARLKSRLRYVLSTERRLALWTMRDRELVCGIAEWRGRPADLVAEQALHRAIEKTERQWVDMSRPDLTAATVDAVRAAGGPVDFEALVGAVTAAAGVVEPRVTGDASVLPSDELSHEVVLDQRRLLTRVWDEVRQLPLRQRFALLLNLRDANGAGLLWLLPVAGIATLRQIASVVEIPDGEFARLWRDLPLDDATIGQRLGCNRQQVINLRMAARKRLMNRVAGIEAWGESPRGRPANLTRVSTSLKGST